MPVTFSALWPFGWWECLRSSLLIHCNSSPVWQETFREEHNPEAEVVIQASVWLPLSPQMTSLTYWGCPRHPFTSMCLCFSHTPLFPPSSLHLCLLKVSFHSSFPSNEDSKCSLMLQTKTYQFHLIFPIVLWILFYLLNYIIYY